MAEEELKYGIGSVSGMAANLVQYDNPMLEAIKKSSDYAILSTRDFVLEWNNLCESSSKLVNSALEHNPKEFLGEHAFLIKPLVQGLLRIMSEGIYITSPGYKLCLFTFLLRRSFIKNNNAEPYRKVVDMQANKIIEFLANNFSVFANDQIDIQSKVAIVRESNLPDEIKSEMLKEFE